MLALALALGIDLVNADLLVPTGDSEQVCSAGEGEIGDGILRRLGHFDVPGEITLRVRGACRRGGSAAEKARHVGGFVARGGR